MKQYRGALTTQQLVEGMNAARENARRLLQDAKVLLEANRYATACSLAILSIEESGKPQLLRMMASSKDAKTLKERWKDYRSHRSKNAMWIMGEMLRNGARHLRDFAPMFDPNSKHQQELDEVKQLGFYTDCLGECRWSRPDAVIGEKLARGMVLVAEGLALNKVENEKEMELWIEHVGHSLGSVTNGQLWRYFDALKQAGLLNHTVEELETFFGPHP